ncbi:MAG: GDSL-type esterase/lipase family protein [Prevotella sp.]|nr:GDSL-type esterase/lipase family protein [Prevotella sp.]
MINDYSIGKPGGMDHFYRQLAAIKKLNHPVRIAYFGDSFTEGDILTADLRDLLQQRFGGNGIGWVDCMNGTNGFRPTICLKAVGLTAHVSSQKPFDANRQGINQRYYSAVGGAQISYMGTSYKKGTSHWQNVQFFFSSPGPTTIEAFSGKQSPRTFTFDGAPTVQCLTIKGDSNHSTFKILKPSAGSVYYGAALESDRGIVLDNLSLRGCLGYTLSSIPSATLNAFARFRPYDLIIIHYGTNVAVSQESEKFFRAYIDKMKHMIAQLRGAYPQASILVMSVPDRDQRTASGIQTLPAIEDLSAYQEVLASECGVAYYNLFQAMGGANSMRKLVDKGWANKDYTHLKFDGGRFVAQKVYNSLMVGYENYKSKKRAGIIE